MKKKKTGAAFVAPIVASWLVSVASTQAGIMYSGAISNIGTDDTMVGSGPWSSGSSLSWVVSQSDTTNEWTYDYTLSGAEKEISHFILGLCPPIDGDDLTISGSHNGETSFGTFNVDNGNPGIPGDLYGMKIDTPVGNSPTSLTFSLVSSLAPRWGDFYAKDGVDDQGSYVYMYNSQFGIEPVISAADDGNNGGYVLIPCDPSETPVVPEPSSAAGLALLLLGGVFFNRRRR